MWVRVETMVRARGTGDGFHWGSLDVLLGCPELVKTGSVQKPCRPKSRLEPGSNLTVHLQSLSPLK